MKIKLKIKYFLPKIKFDCYMYILSFKINKITFISIYNLKSSLFYCLLFTNNKEILCINNEGTKKKQKKDPDISESIYFQWWSQAELNCRHKDFQSFALPTELQDHWLRGKDLNQRPPGYEPDELPDCSTPR